MDISYEIRGRRAVQQQCISAIACDMGISRPAVRKHLNAVAEPKCQRVKPEAPQLGKFAASLSRSLEQEASLPRAQRRTAQR